MGFSTGFLDSLSAKRASLRYGHPSRSLHIIIVTGAYGKTTTALLLANLLEAGGRSVAVFTDRLSRIKQETYQKDYRHSIAALHAALAAASKQRVDFAILEYSDVLSTPQNLASIEYNSVIATTTDSGTARLFSRELDYVVLPYSGNETSVAVAPHQIVYFGEQLGADAMAKDIVLRRSGSELTILLDHHHAYPLASYLTGQANIANIAAAVAMAYVLGVDVDSFEEGVARLERVPGNYDRVSTDGPFTIILDSAKELVSRIEVLKSAKRLAKRRLLVVLDNSHDENLLEAAKSYADQVTVYGVSSIKGSYKLARDRDDAIISTLRGARKDDTVLLLGKGFTSYADGTSTYEIMPLLTGESS